MYIITLYTLNYYEDKYFISLFARFKYKARIYYYRTYTLTITKKKIGNKSFEMHFLSEKF